MNSFGVVFNELKKSGLDIDLKRKTDTGDLVDARENELASLGTKATVASTAGLLKKLTPTERLAWALETKNEANELFKEKQFREAMGKYVEALAGSDFGDKDPNSENKGNVDTMVVPVLCNLAACSLQLEEWGKAVSFSDQVLLLRPACAKAHLRRGIGLMHLGEDELALESFAKAQEVSAGAGRSDSKCPTEEKKGTAGMQSTMELSAQDRRRLPALIVEARQGKAKHAKQIKERKAALARAFARNSALSTDSEVAITEGGMEGGVPAQEQVTEAPLPQHAVQQKAVKEKLPLMTVPQLISFVFTIIYDFLCSLWKPKTE